MESKQFILGLITGEGSFKLRVRDRPDYSVGVECRASFGIHMHKRDAEVLELVREFLDIGGISFRDYGGKSHQESAQYRISSIGECERLCDFIDSSKSEFFEKSDKHNSYLTWRAGVRIISEGRHLTEEGVREFIMLRDDVNDSRRFDSKKRMLDAIND